MFVLLFVFVIVMAFIDIFIFCEMSRIMRKADFCSCENKSADQLRSNCEVDQRLCFNYMDRTTPSLLIFKISTF